MSTWTKLHILETIARYSPALYAIGGGLVTATALTISIAAALYLAAGLMFIGFMVWNEYDRAKTQAQVAADRAERQRRNDELEARSHAREVAHQEWLARRAVEDDALTYGRHSTYTA